MTRCDSNRAARESSSFKVLQRRFDFMSEHNSQALDSNNTIQKATFAAGCFWGVESAFRSLPGVLDAAAGYIGGVTENPTYQDVCSGRTNHAEAVEVDFDPSQISYEQLVEFFFRMHNPTQKNRQGPDVGTQYRSAIFTHSDEQEKIAHAAIEKLKSEGKAIATEVVSAPTFWRAEEYHQRYDEKHGRAGCHVF
jgi:peptide-methionine (S)-S-oxide reductase